MALRAVIDTNVLYGTTTRDAILWVGAYDLFIPLWSEHILNELGFALAKKHPSAAESLVCVLRSKFPQAMVANVTQVTDANLPDAGDLPILACARSSDADYIVTHNLKDFPRRETIPIEAISPDDFLLMLLLLRPAQCLEALRRQWKTYENPPLDAQEYLTRLNRARLHKLSRELRKLDFGAA